MARKYLALFLTIAMLISSFAAVPVFADDTGTAIPPEADNPSEYDTPYDVALETIASETFSDNDYYGIWYNNGIKESLNAKIKGDTAGIGWIGKWLEKDVNGNYVPFANNNTTVVLYGETGESRKAAMYNGTAELYRQLSSPISLENTSGKYIFEVDIKALNSDFKYFKYIINDSLTAGLNYADGKAVPFITLNAGKTDETTVTAFNDIEIKADSSEIFSKFKVIVHLNRNGADTVTVRVSTDGYNASATTTAELTGNCEYVGISTVKCKVDNLYIKGLNYGIFPEADDPTEDKGPNNIALETIASETFTTTDYYGIWANNGIKESLNAKIKGDTAGIGWIGKWLEKDVNGNYAPFANVNTTVILYGETGESGLAARYDVDAELYRELATPIGLENVSGKYIFEVDIKYLNNNFSYFKYIINDSLTAGLNYADGKAVPYIVLNEGTEDETTVTALNNIEVKYDTSTIFSKFKVILDLKKNGADTITVRVSTDGYNASATTTAELTGNCEYIGISSGRCKLDKFYIKGLDYAFLPEADDPTEDVGPDNTALETIASETFLSADYYGIWYNNGINESLNAKIKGDTAGTGWIGKWLEKAADGNYAPLADDNKAVILYGETGESGLAARYDVDAELYRELSAPISLEKVSGKYIFEVDIKYLNSNFTYFKYIINDSLTTGLTYADGKAVPYIVLNEGTEDETTVTALNNIEVKYDTSTIFSKFKVILDLKKNGADTVTVRVSTDGYNASATTTAELTGNCEYIGISSVKCKFDNLYIKGLDYASLPEADDPFEAIELNPMEKIASEPFGTDKYTNLWGTKGPVSNSYYENVVRGTGWTGDWLDKDETGSFVATTDTDAMLYPDNNSNQNNVGIRYYNGAAALYRQLASPISFDNVRGKYIFSTDVNKMSGLTTFKYIINDSVTAGFNMVSGKAVPFIILNEGTDDEKTVTAVNRIEVKDFATKTFTKVKVILDLNEDGADTITVRVSTDGYNASATTTAELTGNCTHIGIDSAHVWFDNISVLGLSGQDMGKIERIDVQNGEFKSGDGLTLLETSKITDSVVYSFNLFNYLKEEKLANIFMGVFYDGRLAGIKTLSMTVAPRSVSDTLTVGFEDALPEGNKENISVKVFVLEKGTYAPFTDRIDMYSQNDRTVKPEIFGKDAEKQTIVAFMGDSITHMNPSYAKWIEYYYRIKYPTKDIRFVNKGISGDSASGNYGRFTWDILNGLGTGTPTEACIMIGMNDVGRHLYPNGSDEDKQVCIDTCLANIETIADACEEKGIKLTLITPTLYDEADYTTNASNTGVNAALGKIAERVIKLANEKNLAYIDFYGYINSFNSSLRSGLYANSTLFNVLDRIHATPEGTFTEGFIFLDQQINDPVIASATIDVDSLTAETDSAAVENIAFADGILSYTYKPESIPMYTTDEYITCNDTYGIPVTDSINREIIKVSGLAEGSYKIKFGDADLGIYTAAQLAEGVNIATVSTNPGQLQSKTVYDLVNSKMGKEYVLRNIAFVERAMWNKVDDLSDVDACIEYFKNNLSSSSDSTYAAYETNKRNQATIISEIAQLEAEAKAAAQPGTYNVQIIKQ